MAKDREVMCVRVRRGISPRRFWWSCDTVVFIGLESLEVTRIKVAAERQQ